MNESAGFMLGRIHVDSVVLVMVAMALWLLNHPYQGIWHDARVYGLIAAHWLHPNALAHDLFFQYGSQGDVSLFTPLYGEFVRWQGLDRAAWWVVLIGGGLWIGACFALAQGQLGHGFAGRFAVLLGAVAIVSYSPNGDTFLIGENYATARAWAIPLGLWSAAALMARRLRWAFALALLAIVLHPLLGIWPLTLSLLARMSHRVVALLVLLSLLLMLALGIINPPLPYLRLMDGDWAIYVTNSAKDVVLKRPEESHLGQYIGVLAALWIGVRVGDERSRPLYLRMFWLGIAVVGLTLITSYVFLISVVVQGQPWRGMALLMPLAMLALLDVAQRLCRTSSAGLPLMVLAGAIFILGITVWLPILCGLSLLVQLSPPWMHHIDTVFIRYRSILVAGIGLLWMVLLPGLVTELEITGNQQLRPWWEGSQWLYGLVAGNSWYAAVLLALIGPSLRQWTPRISGLVVLALLGGGGVLLVTNWDRRPDARQLFESCYLNTGCAPHPFVKFIPLGASVYWPENELMIWFTLNRVSYFGNIQHVGDVFSQPRFDTWVRRAARVKAAPDLRHLCMDETLDWVVLRGISPGLLPRARAGSDSLFACADTRAVRKVSASEYVHPRNEF